MPPYAQMRHPESMELLPALCNIVAVTQWSDGSDWMDTLPKGGAVGEGGLGRGGTVLGGMAMGSRAC